MPWYSRVEAAPKTAPAQSTEPNGSPPAAHPKPKKMGSHISLSGPQALCSHPAPTVLWMARVHRPPNLGTAETGCSPCLGIYTSTAQSVAVMRAERLRYGERDVVSHFLFGFRMVPRGGDAMLVQMFGRLNSVVGWIPAVCAVTAMALGHGGASNENANSCDVIGIRIREREPAMTRMTYEFDLRDPARCEKGSWNIRVLSVDGGQSYSNIRTNQRQGGLCFPNPGKFKLKVGSVTSGEFDVPSLSVNYSLAFLSFNTKILALNLNTRGDNRAASWRLSVFRCRTRRRQVDSRYVEEECARVPGVGCDNCSTHIRLDADFASDACYVFHLDPIGKDETCLLQKDNSYFTHPAGCHPSAPATPQPQEGRLTPLWFIFLAVGVMLAGVTCALMMVMLRGKLCGHFKNDGVANSGSATKAKRQPLPVMVLYARDGVEHLARVAAFLLELKRQVDCQILDLHDERHAHILADPAGYILEATSIRSFTRVILVLSSEVTRLQRSFLENESDAEAPSEALGRVAKPQRASAPAALKRLPVDLAALFQDLRRQNKHQSPLLSNNQKTNRPHSPPPQPGRHLGPSPGREAAGGRSPIPSARTLVAPPRCSLVCCSLLRVLTLLSEIHNEYEDVNVSFTLLP
ncbi:uncharacterized protein LOC119598492 [Penaeus monodon]|uniref:uncharacterized protein LOC119598492 n=1 Tax=Penaeus monodon TaxID=6687 RepID=UPI0018A74534|nr:uncharacterized protein LOC119598492 [Penaeus monodon]